MAEENNIEEGGVQQPQGLLDANALYTEIEGEQGLELNLGKDQKLNLAGLIQSRFQTAEDSRNVHETRWLTAYQN